MQRNLTIKPDGFQSLVTCYRAIELCEDGSTSFGPAKATGRFATPGIPFSYLTLNSSWRQNKSDNILEFVAIAEENFIDSFGLDTEMLGNRFGGIEKDVVHALAITTVKEQDSIKYCSRIQPFMVNKEIWEMAKPVPWTICLV